MNIQIEAMNLYALSHACAVQDVRSNILNTIYFDHVNQRAVATNGHILAYCPAIVESNESLALMPASKKWPKNERGDTIATITHMENNSYNMTVAGKKSTFKQYILQKNISTFPEYTRLLKRLDDAVGLAEHERVGLSTDVLDALVKIAKTAKREFYAIQIQSNKHAQFWQCGSINVIVMPYRVD